MRIGGYVRSSLVDFPARVASVVFVQGCDLRCPWCHNPALVRPALFSPPIPEEDVFRHLEERRGKLSGVVVTGGEPTLQPDLAAFLERVRSLGFSVKLDTNGTRPDVLEDILGRGLADFVAVDLKAPWSRYREACGTEVDIDALRRSIDLLRSSGVDHQLRTTDWAAFPPDQRREIEEIATGSVHAWQEFRRPLVVAPV